MLRDLYAEAATIMIDANIDNNRLQGQDVKSINGCQ